ncbi:MAG: hypothetical protein AAFQ54_09160 [Pseudomonadota bacterium]
MSNALPILSLAMNVAVLAPLCAALISGNAGMDAAYGPPSPARGILTGVYLAILLASVGLLASLFSAPPWWSTALVTLLVLQCAYKLLTIPLVGMGNPVVVANTAITALHLVTLWWVLLRAA